MKRLREYRERLLFVLGVLLGSAATTAFWCWLVTR
jgi:hypothetical protein